MTSYIIHGALEKCTPTIEKMPFGEVKSSMENLANVTDEEEFKERPSFSADLMMVTQSHLEFLDVLFFTMWFW